MYVKRCSAWKDALSFVIRCYCPAFTKHRVQDPLLHTVVLHCFVEALRVIGEIRNLLGLYRNL